MIVKKIFFLIILLIVLLIGAGLIIYKAKVVQKPPVVSYLKKKIVIKKKEYKCQVAIVIDDWGYNLENLDQICSVKKPITLSVLPNLPYSKKIAYEASKRGCEIILHLPLEPREEDTPKEIDTISTNMSEVDVIEKLYVAFNSVPTLKGLSNHMGSKATANENLMCIIFNELKKKDLYFLDSLVMNKSVCEEVAEEAGIRFAKRDIYLDNINSEDYIKNQFKSLVRKAKKKGFSIGIGHDRSLTIKTLAEEMPAYEKQGIEFVFVSELVNY